ncbi:MAG: hypothetical protein ABIM16_00975 [Ginsengibacter sp.]
MINIKAPGFWKLFFTPDTMPTNINIIGHVNNHPGMGAPNLDASNNKPAASNINPLPILEFL